MSALVRVVVVDDSPLSAEALRRALERDHRIAVAAVGHDGLRAVELAASVRPALMTMDVHMPRMNGLEAISRIMQSHPTRILVVTEDGRATLPFEALRRGALELVRRPIAVGAWAQEEEASLRARVLSLAQLPLARPSGPIARAPRTAPTAPVSDPPRRPIAAVGVVASTGGPAALAAFLGALPRPFPTPILIVQHLAPGFAPGLADWLTRTTKIPTTLASHGATLRAGQALLCPDDVHLGVDARGRAQLDAGPPVDGHRPSASRLLGSLAAELEDAALGVVLTGMGRDGASGVAALRAARAVVFAQDEASSVVHGMPRAAVEAAPGVIVGPPERLAQWTAGICDVRGRA